eukprot:353785-Chlamydomonas_euryale.AAC.1
MSPRGLLPRRGPAGALGQQPPGALTRPTPCQRALPHCRPLRSVTPGCHSCSTLNPASPEPWTS